MDPILAIVKKDLKAFFTNPMFYVLTGLCCLLWGIFFSVDVFNFVQQSYKLSMKTKSGGLNVHHHLIASYLVVVHYVLVFIIAALSLRFFAEEKKMKTFPVLLSSPIASWQIVLAKWLSGALVIFTLLLISSVFPVSLIFFIELPMGLLFYSYLGLFLLLCIYLSVALLASSMTESLIVCVVLALVFNLSLLLLGIGGELTDSLTLQNLFKFLSFDGHFANFRGGILNLSSILYLLSWSLCLGFLTERVVEFHRWR